MQNIKNIQDIQSISWRSVWDMARVGWIFGLVIGFLAIAPYLRWGIFNHDGQRLVQLLLFGVVLLAGMVPPWNQRLWALWLRLGWGLRWSLIALFVIGAASSALALYPRWATLEWAWYGAWLCVVGVVAGVRQSGAQWDKVLVFGLWLV